MEMVSDGVDKLGSSKGEWGQLDNWADCHASHARGLKPLQFCYVQQVQPTVVNTIVIPTAYLKESYD